MRPEFASRLWNFSDNAVRDSERTPPIPQFPTPNPFKTEKSLVICFKGNRKEGEIWRRREMRFGDDSSHLNLTR